MDGFGDLQPPAHPNMKWCVQKPRLVDILLIKANQISYVSILSWALPSMVADHMLCSPSARGITLWVTLSDMETCSQNNINWLCFILVNRLSHENEDFIIWNRHTQCPGWLIVIVAVYHNSTQTCDNANYVASVPNRRISLGYYSATNGSPDF